MGLLKKYQKGDKLDRANNKKAKRILKENKDKPFVGRVLHPRRNKGKEVRIDGSDEPSTHYMEWGSGDGKYWVYPTVQEQTDGSLKYEKEDSYLKARANNNAIPFDTAEEAAWFSQNYKTKKFIRGYKK